MQSLSIKDGENVKVIARVLRAPVNHVTQTLTKYIQTGSVNQVYRLARWLMSQTNGASIVESMSNLMMISALETMGSEVIVNKKTVPCKLSVPGIACVLIWQMVVMRLQKSDSNASKL
jgi:hypothetical protein